MERRFPDPYLQAAVYGSRRSPPLIATMLEKAHNREPNL